jgi:hypothetical protein
VPHTQQHSDTATQQHSNARSLPHTAAHGNQRAPFTQTPKHTAAQCHTQRHSNTATQQCTLTATHCRPRRSESNIHTDIQTQSATATHTTTLHTQRARHHCSNTQRRRGITHPPTTASSSLQRSHSRRHTQHFHRGVAVAVGSYTTAVRQCDCDMHDQRTRVALVRSTDCQNPPQPLATDDTRATQRHASTHASPQPSETPQDAQTRAPKPSKNDPTQRCAVAHQPQRGAVQQRTCDNSK